MAEMITILIVWAIICAGSVAQYAKAKYPERKRWYYRIPPGGYFALYFLDPDKD